MMSAAACETKILQVFPDRRHAMGLEWDIMGCVTIVDGWVNTFLLFAIKHGKSISSWSSMPIHD